MALATFVLVLLHLVSIFCQTIEDCDYEVPEKISLPAMQSIKNDEDPYPYPDSDWRPYSSYNSTDIFYGNGWLEDAFIPLPLNDSFSMADFDPNDNFFNRQHARIGHSDDSILRLGQMNKDSAYNPRNPMAMPELSNTVAVSMPPPPLRMKPMYKGSLEDASMVKITSTLKEKPLKKRKISTTTTTTEKIRLGRKRPISAVAETVTETATTRKKLKRKITTTTESFRKRRITTGSLTR